MKARLPTVVIAVILIQGCAITHTPGLYSGYSRLNEADKVKVVLLGPDEPICDLDKDANLYAVTGGQLRASIDAEQTALINPILYINERHYDTRSCNRYTDLFEADLLQGTELSREDRWTNILIFTNGRLTACSIELCGAGEQYITCTTEKSVL